MLTNRKTYKKGEVIVREHTPGNSAYILESGRVSVSRNVGNQRVEFAELGPGAIFGEMCLVDDSPRSASVIAVDDSVVTVLSKVAFQQALSKLPPAVLSIFRVIVGRLRETDVLINPLKLSNFYFSLCRLILCLARGEGQLNGVGESSLDPDKLVKECCTILALDRDLVEKVLNRLAFTRLVRLDKSKAGGKGSNSAFVIPSVDRFSQFVDFMERHVVDNSDPAGAGKDFLPEKTFEILRVMNENMREFQGVESRVSLPIERFLQALHDLLGFEGEEGRVLLQPLLESGILKIVYEPETRSSLLVCPDKSLLTNELDRQNDLRLFTKMVNLLKSLAC